MNCSLNSCLMTLESFLIKGGLSEWFSSLKMTLLCASQNSIILWSIALVARTQMVLEQFTIVRWRRSSYSPNSKRQTRSKVEFSGIYLYRTEVAKHCECRGSFFRTRPETRYTAVHFFGLRSCLTASLVPSLCMVLLGQRAHPHG